MFAIAFDLVVAETAQHHPKGVAQAYPTSVAHLPISG
jgi:virulence-associated protein VapD